MNPDSNPCGEFGTCNNIHHDDPPFQFDQINSFECVCQSGKTGTFCEIDDVDDLCDMHFQYNPNFCGAEQGHGACREVAHPTEPMTDTARSDKSEESG